MKGRSSRRQARVLAFQALYALGEDMIGDLEGMVTSIQAFATNGDTEGADMGLLNVLATGTSQYKEIAFGCLENSLEVPFGSINRVDQLILLLATVELLARPDTPKAVVINEWIEISKEFGAHNGFKLVNVVLDNVKLPTSDVD